MLTISSPSWQVTSSEVTETTSLSQRLIAAAIVTLRAAAISGEFGANT